MFMKLDKKQTDAIIDTILGLSGSKVVGPLNTWKHIETFTNAWRRCYYRAHYFEALRELRINFLEIEI